MKLHSCLALAALLFGCVQQSTPDVPPELTKIRIRSGVWGLITSKAPVVAGDTFRAQVCGWLANGATTDWSATPSWQSESDILAGTTATEMILNPIRTYDKEGLTTTVRGWYPQGTLETGRVSFANPTGEVDVMLSSAVSGTQEAPITTSMYFTHLATQLRFVVVDAGWFSEEPIQAVEIKGVELPVGIDLGSGLLVSGGVVDLMVPGVEPGGVSPTKQGAALGRAVMVLPIESTKLTIDIVTPQKRYTNVEVMTTDTQFTAGRAYTVTLTFSGDRTIKVGSEMGDWLTEHQGSVDLS